MYMCMCIYICIYMYMCMYMCIYIYVFNLFHHGPSQESDYN